MCIRDSHHPALDVNAIDHVIVSCRTVRVAVDERGVAICAQEVVGRSGIDVHQESGLATLGRFALLAQRKDHLLTFGQRLGEKGRLPIRLANERAKRLVLAVIGAQRIAVGEDELPCWQRQDMRVGEQARTAARQEGFAEQEIAVAMHQRQLDAAAG